MSEVVQLQHLTGERKSSHLQIKNEDDLEGFGSEPKKKISGELLSPTGQTKQVSLIERPLVNYEGDSTYEKLWNMCKEAGLPVAPTMRRTDRGTVVFGDLAANGSEFYGKSMWDRLSMRKRRPHENIFDYIKLMPRFLNILENDQDNLKLKLESIVEIANKNNISIPEDDPFDLRVNPDGSWNIFMLDLEGVCKRDGNYPQDKLIEGNNKARNEFMRELSDIKVEYGKLMSEQT